MSNWRQSSWGEVAELVYGKALRDYHQSVGAARVYGTNGPVGWTDVPHSAGPGVIIGRKGAYRGVRFSPDAFAVIDTAYWLRPRSELDLRWAYYALLGVDINSMDSGSAIPSLSRADFYALPIEIPPVQEQRAIAELLGALDDKIDLNRRLCRTLEQIAEAVFRARFVDFEDAEELVESEIGWIPRGWRVSALHELAREMKRGIAPAYAESGVAVISQRCIRNERIDWNRIRRHDVSRRGVDGRLVGLGDVLINSTGIGTLGRIAQITFLPEPAIVDSHVTIVRAAESVILPSILARLLFDRYDEIEGMGQGSTGQTELRRDVLGALHLPIPPRPAQEAFDAFVRPIERLRDRLIVQSETLARLRDALLPKLISGELRIAT